MPRISATSPSEVTTQSSTTGNGFTSIEMLIFPSSLRVMLVFVFGILMNPTVSTARDCRFTRTIAIVSAIDGIVGAPVGPICMRNPGMPRYTR